MRVALQAYLDRAALGGDHRAAVVAGAEAVAERPWDVVHQAGRLARAIPVQADKDLGLTNNLRVVGAGSRAAVLRVEQGQTYPLDDTTGRRKRGAYDTPVDMARLVVEQAVQSVRGTLQTGLDIACGTGAFLVAMAEAGVPEIYGTDLDALALDVARVACPRARLLVSDALKHGPSVDLVCGNPPYVPPERQDRTLRDALRRQFPWLRGRFDLVVPFAAVAAERVRPGGGLGLVLPFAALVQPYGAVLRRRWVERHRITALSGPHPFKGASVKVGLVALCAGEGPAPLANDGIHATELLRLDVVPLSPGLQPGDVDIIDRMRADTTNLGELCLVDTGLVAHGPAGGKARLLFDEPGEGRVRYADAKGFFTEQWSWLQYDPPSMHRPKRPAMFEAKKLVIQRIRGRGPIRARVDVDGIYVGHTCTVVVPHDPTLDLASLRSLVCSPLIDGLTRIERGQRLDLYPRDVAAIPIPDGWREDPTIPLERAFGLSEAQAERLVAIAAS